MAPATWGAANEVPRTWVVASGKVPPRVRSVVRTPSPGATRAGKILPSQAEGPRPELFITSSSSSTPPTAKAPGLLAGLMLVAVFGPALPAEKTTAMPAALNTWISSANS